MSQPRMTKRETRCALTALALGVLLFSICQNVRADEVMPPPAACPPGTRPQTSHAGPHCGFFHPCTESSCVGGLRCEPRSYCVQDMPCGGMPEPGREDCTVQFVLGPCGAAGNCTDGARCISHPTCVSDAAPTAVAPTAVAPIAAPGTTTPTTATEERQAETSAAVPTPSSSACHAAVRASSAPTSSLVTCLCLALLLIARKR